MSNPVTPGQPGGSPYGASGPQDESSSQGQFGPTDPQGQGQFGPTDPQGQGQFGAAPQGQFGPAGPQGQGQFGPPPGGPDVPVGPQGQAGAPVGFPPPEPKKRGKGRLIVALVAVVVVVIIAIVVWVATRSSPVNAKVGDCLQGSDINSTSAQDASGIKIVSCTSTAAKYKVVGKVDNKTKTQFSTDNNICQAFTTATTALWGQTSGNNGFVLCLSDAPK